MITNSPNLSKAKAGAAEHVAKHEQKHFLMCAGMYLNQSGHHLQHGRTYAWQGTIEQAKAARAVFNAAVGCKAVPVLSLNVTLQSIEEAA